MDGLDLVAVNFNAALPKVEASHQVDYPAELKQQLIDLATRPEATISRMCELDTRLGQFYGTQINDFIDAAGIERTRIRAIGSHGQTIRHDPDNRYPHSLQIGDPNIINVLTGLPVVADLRRRDVALGGQGAPFAPAFHNQVFRSSEFDRVIINIGGIANITYLPADADQPVYGFDTGPGNTLLDGLSRSTLDQDYDDNGNFARSGKVDSDRLQATLDNEPYFSRPAPKSTGTDYFSPAWLDRSDLLDLQPADAMATLVELTCSSLARGIASLPSAPAQCFVCGGGAHNGYLLERLRTHLPQSEVQTTDALGVDPDLVEALAFAWLARQTINHRPGNLPSVTNAQKFTILGGLYY